MYLFRQAFQPSRVVCTGVLIHVFKPTVMGILIAVLILVGIVLLIAEIIFIPGTTVVGILGAVFMMAGIVFTYGHFGQDTGYKVLIATGIATAVLLYIAFKKGAWSRFSLQDTSHAKVNEGLTQALAAGDEGTAVSALRPMGTAEFKDKVFEVKTNGDYLAAGSRVRIVQIQANEILVEPIS